MSPADVRFIPKRICHEVKYGRVMCRIFVRWDGSPGEEVMISLFGWAEGCVQDVLLKLRESAVTYIGNNEIFVGKYMAGN